MLDEVCTFERRVLPGCDVAPINTRWGHHLRFFESSSAALARHGGLTSGQALREDTLCGLDLLLC